MEKKCDMCSPKWQADNLWSMPTAQTIDDTIVLASDRELEVPSTTSLDDDSLFNVWWRGKHFILRGPGKLEIGIDCISLNGEEPSAHV
jgi:hypothetical protein